VANARPAADRFWEKVSAEGPCWEWMAAKMKNGYGVFNLGRGLGTTLAHRFAYEQTVGTIGSGLQLDHLCRNRACVNPDHLEPVSQQENLRRGSGFVGVNLRKKTCPRGHVYDAVYVGRGKSERRCTSCMKSYAYPKRRKSYVASRKPRLTVTAIAAMRAEYATSDTTYVELAKKYGLGRHHVGRVVRRQAWKDVK